MARRDYFLPFVLFLEMADFFFDRFYREKRSVAGYILDTLDEHKRNLRKTKLPLLAWKGVGLSVF
jgi:hypothetical protein